MFRILEKSIDKRAHSAQKADRQTNVKYFSPIKI